MARLVYNFENPDRFLAGTVGQPGNRTFYLQARDGDRIVGARVVQPGGGVVGAPARAARDAREPVAARGGFVFERQRFERGGHVLLFDFLE